LEQARTLFDSSRFKEAIDIAQIGLKTFPANPDLLHLYQQAEIQQRKLEARQKIEERVREIRVKINREKFSDAINLAKQTLVTLGPDPKLTELLNTAEVQFEAREGTHPSNHSHADRGWQPGRRQPDDRRGYQGERFGYVRPAISAVGRTTQGYGIREAGRIDTRPNPASYNSRKGVRLSSGFAVTACSFSNFPPAGLNSKRCGGSTGA
jgi:hypothetical protein